MSELPTPKQLKDRAEHLLKITPENNNDLNLLLTKLLNSSDILSRLDKPQASKGVIASYKQKLRKFILNTVAPGLLSQQEFNRTTLEILTQIIKDYRK